MHRDPLYGAGVEGLLKAEGRGGTLKETPALKAPLLAQDNNSPPV